MPKFNLSKKSQLAVKVYNKIYQKKTSEMMQIYPDEMVVRIVKNRFIKEGIKNVLDAGCGEGRNALMMANEGLKVTCLDTSKAALQLVRKQAKIFNLTKLNYHQASITKMPFKNNQFDAIICWRLIYYLNLKEAYLAMSEFKRVVRPGGLVYLSLPDTCYNFKTRSYDPKKPIVKASNGIFLRRYTEDESKDLFKGFVKLEYGIQAQSFLGEPKEIQSFWHVLGQKP